MKSTPIKAVEMVRQIRDEHDELLKNKSIEEIKAFYHQKAEIVNDRARRLLQQSRTEEK